MGGYKSAILCTVNFTPSLLLAVSLGDILEWGIGIPCLWKPLRTPSKPLPSTTRRSYEFLLFLFSKAESPAPNKCFSSNNWGAQIVPWPKLIVSECKASLLDFQQSSRRGWSVPIYSWNVTTRNALTMIYLHSRGTLYLSKSEGRTPSHLISGVARFALSWDIASEPCM